MLTELYLQETFKPLVHISPDARYVCVGIFIQSCIHTIVRSVE